MIHSILYPLIFKAVSASSGNCMPKSLDVETANGLIEYHASINLHDASEAASRCDSEMDVFIIGGEDIQDSEAVLAVKDIVSYHLGESVRLINTINESRDSDVAVVFRPRL